MKRWIFISIQFPPKGQTICVFDRKAKRLCHTGKVDLIAITNHNLFDAQQFSDITNALPIKVFPGIEVDIEGGHLIVITDPSDIDDFTENARKFIALTKQVKIHIFPKHNLWKYLMILENIS